MTDNQGPYSDMFAEQPEHRMGRLHQELRAIHLELGRLEQETLIHKARLVNRANQIMNELEQDQ